MMKRHLLLLLLLCLSTQNTILLSTTPSTTKINTLSNYTFQFSRDVDPMTNDIITNIAPATSSSVITITFPSTYVNLTNGAYKCSAGLTCTMSDHVLTILGYYNSTGAKVTDPTLNFTVQSIVNPLKTGQSGEFAYTIQSNTGTVQDKSPDAGSQPMTYNSVTFTAGTFASCSLTTSGIVYSKSTITLTATPTNPIPSSGTLQISLPQYWSSSYMTDSLITDSLNCSSLSTLSNTLTCSYQTSPEYTVITFNSLSGSTITSGFSLSFGSVTLPPTVNSSDVITIYSRLSTGEMIDTCTAMLTGVQGAVLQGEAFTSTNTTVSREFNGSLSFINTVLVSLDDTIIVTVPSTLGMPTMINVSSFTGFSNLTTNNIISIYNFAGNNLASLSTLTITLFSCTNPPNTKPISNFTITIQRNGWLVQSGTVGYSTTPGTLTATLDSAVFNTNKMTSSQLVVITGSGIEVGGYITMEYTYAPKALTSGVVSQCTVNGVVVNTASYGLAGQLLTFSNIFQNAGSSAGNISINFTEFTNPPTIQSVTLTVNTYSIDSYLIDTGTLTYTAIAATIPAPTLTSSNYTVLSVSTLAISFVADAPYTSVSIITPSQVTLSADLSTRACTSPDQPLITSTCLLNSTNLTFTSASPLNGTTTLSWSGNIMPASYKPTSRFQVFTYSSGWLVESFIGMLTITMNQTAGFVDATHNMSSKMNSQSASLTIGLTLPTGSPNGGTLRITIPAPVTINSGLACTLNGVAVTCGLSGNTVSIANVSNTPLVNTLVLSSVTTPPSLQSTSQPVTISLQDSSGFSSLFSSLSVIQNTQVAPISSISLTTGVGFYGQTTNLTLLATLNGNQAYTLLSLPPEFPSLSSSPCANCTLPTPTTIRLNTTSTSLSLLLTIPTSALNTTSGFTLVSYSTSNFQIQTGASNSWYPKCASTVCRDCTGTVCLDCYQNTTISLYSILKDNTCVKECNQTGYYLVGVLCQPCDPNCKECTGTSRNCTQCNANMYLDGNTTTCVTVCPDKTYKNDTLQYCSACVNQCEKCTNSTNCTSCQPNYYLLNSTCNSTCPINVYIQNTLSWTCDPCSTNCLTCQNYTFTCTTCDTSIPLYLDQNISTCVSSCTGGLVPKNGVCSVCDSPCKTCSGTTTNCTSCDNTSTTNPYLYNNTCILNCPAGLYANGSSASCQPCPGQCATCTTSTICTSCCTNCTKTYYYYNSSSCIESCPDGTFILSSTICKACNSSCQTCSDENVCVTCTYPLLLNGSTCYVTCPPQTYANSLSTCTPCLNNCSTCLTSTYCLTCLSSTYLFATTCVSPCPDGTYINTTNCFPCPTGCTTCANSTQCTKCNTGYSMENQLCVVSCDVGISVNQQCYPCGLNCANCAPDCTNCTPECSACEGGYSKYGLYCVGQCPKTSVSISQVCQNCTKLHSSDCLTCTATACLTCNKGALIDGQCQDCPNGTFPSLNMCQDCPGQCTTCRNNSYCESCVDGRYLYQNACISTCPVNMVPEGTGCIECKPNCSLCDQALRVCAICFSSYYVSAGSCVVTCPEGLVISKNRSNCVTPYEFYKEYSQESKILYFPFTISAAILLILALIFKCKFASLHFWTFTTAVISIIEVAIWAVFLWIEVDVYTHGHDTGFLGMILLSVSLFCMLLLNLIQVCLFNKYFPQDVQYQKWQKKQNHHCSTISLLSISSCTHYKFFRISYSRLFQKSNFCLDLTSPNSLKPIDILTIVGTFLATAPAIAGGALAMVYSIARDQEYWVAIDCVIVSVLGGLLALVDLKRSKDYFSDDFEAMKVKNVYKLQSDIQSQVKVNFDEDEHAQMNDPTMGKTFFKSTTGAVAKALKFQPQDSQNDLNHLPHQPKQASLEQSQSQQNLLDETEYNPTCHWVPVVKNTDEFGYQIRINEQGEEEKYDKNGYRVVVQDGKHVKYDQDNLRVEKNSKGEIIRYDEEGLEVRENGRRYDGRGYRAEGKEGERKYYNSEGYEVRIESDGKEVTYDKEGDIVKVNPKTGEYEKYDEQGFRIVVDESGNRTKYDEEGLKVQVNPQTGQLTKYDSRGYKVVDLQSGQRQFYNEDGYKVEQNSKGQQILRDDEGFIVKNVNGQLKRFDDDDLIVIKDPETGNYRKYDAEGYQVVEVKGKKVKFDKHGFRVQKNYYGGVTLYDQNNCVVEVDGEGNVGKIRPDGLKSVVDKEGRETLWDQRGNQVIFDEQGNYIKINPQGNQIELDDFGYENGIDQQGKPVRYDLAGNIVIEDDDLIMFQQDDEFGDQAVAEPPIRNKQRKINLKPNKVKELNFDEELKKMVDLEHQKFGNEEQSDIYAKIRLSELEQLDGNKIRQNKLDKELHGLVEQNRSGFVEDTHPVLLDELKEIRVIPKEELIEKMHFSEEEEEKTNLKKKGVKKNDIIFDQIVGESKKDFASRKHSKKIKQKLKNIINKGGQQSKVLSEQSIPEQNIEESKAQQSIAQQISQSQQDSHQKSPSIPNKSKKHSKKPHLKQPSIIQEDLPADDDGYRTLLPDSPQSHVDQPVSVRDAELSERTEVNNGVEAPAQKFDDDLGEEESIELDKNMVIVMNRKGKSKNYVDLGRSQHSYQLPEGQHHENDIDTKTEYRKKDIDGSIVQSQSQGKFNTLDVNNSQSNKATKIDRKGRGLYDPHEEIESMSGSVEWQDGQQQVFNQVLHNPPIYNPPRSSAESAANFRTPIVNFIEEQVDNKDTLSDYVDFHIQQEKTVKGKKPSISKRMPPSIDRSIEVEQQRLFRQAEQPRRIRQMSNTPNPLISYAQTIDNDRYDTKKSKNLERIYLQQSTDTVRRPKK